MSYKIGKKEFKTKTTITNYFSFILKSVKEGSILEGQYLIDVLGLLEYHTEKEDKIGCGINYIKVEKHTDIINGFKSKTCHFHIYRVDGTNIDFSYKNCVNNIGKDGYKSKKRDDVMKSLRFVVRPQIDSFRTEAREEIWHMLNELNKLESTKMSKEGEEAFKTSKIELLKEYDLRGVFIHELKSLL